MKMKSFAMLAVSSLVAASFAYIAPAMADDTSSTSGQSMPNTPADTSNVAGMPSDNSMNANNSNSNNSASPSTDEGSSPDTATGDDDY